MARLPVEVANGSNQRNGNEIHAGEELQEEVMVVEALTPSQRMHRRFNKAAARANALKRLIAIRQADGADFTSLCHLLKDAEAEKEEAHVELRRLVAQSSYPAGENRRRDTSRGKK